MAGCSESDEEKVARVERAIEQHKQGTVMIDPNKDKPITTAAEEVDASKKLVLFAASDLQDPYQAQQSALLEMAVRKLDGCAFKALDAGGKADTQLKQLNDARLKRPAYLVLSPVDAASVAKLAEEMRREGTMVVGVDERLTAKECSAVVFVNQKNMGALAGQEIIEALKRKAADEGKPAVSGRVVHLMGDSTSFAAKARAEGLRESLKKEPGIILVHEAPGKWTRDGGKLRTEDALRLQHEFDVVCAQNDQMAQGASDALTTAQVRDRVLIVGMDGGVELVRKSLIDVAILQPMPLQTAYDYIAKGVRHFHFVPPSTTELNPKTLTPITIDAFVSENLRKLKQ